MSQPAQILVVDDEVNIRLTLNALLSRAGYGVSTAANGEEAVSLLNQRPFDLLLVDLKMPGIDGMQVVSAARSSQPTMAIIVLTGHGSLETAVEGLHQGIFDYLLKTTEPAQVVERVAAALDDRRRRLHKDQLLDLVGAAIQELRGPAPANQPAASASPPVAPVHQPVERVITIGELQLDSWRQVATLNNHSLALTPTEFRLLLCLAEHAGQMLSYSQLVRCAQGYDADENEASELIKPHIHHLRQKLEPDPSAPRYLLNVRGKGYLLQMG